MGLRICVATVLLFPSLPFALSLPPQPSLESGTNPLPGSNVSSVIASLFSNVSTPAQTIGWDFGLATSNTPGGQDITGDPNCNVMFGTDLRLESCLDTLRTLNIPVNTNMRTFGDRGRNCNVQLPRRSISRESYTA